MGGIKKPIGIFKKGGDSIKFPWVDFRIRAQLLVLKPHTSLHVQGFLSPGPNSNRYALDALPEDLATRLSINGSGTDTRYNLHPNVTKFPRKAVPVNVAQKLLPWPMAVRLER